MKRNLLRVGCLLITGCLLLAAAAKAEPPKLRVLILSGSNNHNWKQTTPVLQDALERSGRFVVSVTESPQEMTAEALAAYDVIVSNWNTFTSRDKAPKDIAWPEATRKAFLDFVREGKGLLTVHAGSSSFYDWAEYQQISLGSFKIGQTGHGKYHEFDVAITAEHPITHGLSNFKTTDELWHRTPIQDGSTVLARAFSAKETGGSGNDEPVCVAANVGKGRSVFLVLGHDASACTNGGFQTLLTRGTEWAATGQVTLPTAAPTPSAQPAPAADATLAPALQALRNFKVEDDRQGLQPIVRAVAAAKDDPAARLPLADALLTIVASPDASAAAKRFALGQLALVASEKHVPALVAALNDPPLAVDARAVLEAIPGEAVDAALRDALAGTQGPRVLGIVGSLGARRDAAAVPALAPLLASKDAHVVNAAAWALGRIATGPAADALTDALLAAPPAAPTRRALAEALLAATRGLQIGGNVPRANQALQAIVACGAPAPAQMLADDLRSSAEAALLSNQQLLQAILEDATSTERFSQAAAVEALRRVNKPDWTLQVTQKLAALPADLQLKLLAILVEQGEAGALPVLTTALSSDDPARRELAIEGLGKIGDAASLDPLLNLAEKPSSAELELLDVALARLRGEDVNGRLVSHLAGARPAVQVLIARALVSRGATAAAPELLKLARGGDAKVAPEALKATGELADGSACSELIAMLSDKSMAKLEPQVRGALSAICKRAGRDVGPLVKAYDEAEPAQRQSLLVVIASVGGEQARGLLRRELASTDAATRTEAVRSLSTWPDADAIPDLLPVARTSQVVVDKTLALRGLAKLIPVDAKSAEAHRVALLGECLKLAPDAQTRNLLVTAIGNVPSPEAIQAAVSLLEDKDLGNAAALATIRLAYRTDGHVEQRTAALNAVLQSKQKQTIYDQAKGALGEINPKPTPAPAPPPTPAPALRWAQEDGALALLGGEQVVWRFHYGPEAHEPYFDPLAPVGGPSISWNAPPDHVWHHGLWFCWKYLNKVNYWEINKATGKPDGTTRTSNVHCETHPDGSARLTMDVQYAVGDAPPVLTEKRTIGITAPGVDGAYAMQWTMTFTAGAGDVLLDRTPPPDGKSGVAHGGYAGLSLRMQKLDNVKVHLREGPGEFDKTGRIRVKSGACDYAGDIEGHTIGVMMLDHPSNIHAPSPWYVINGGPMRYLNAAVICFEPHTLKAGESFTLKYRVVVHRGAWTEATLDRAAKAFAEQ